MFTRHLAFKTAWEYDSRANYSGLQGGGGAESRMGKPGKGQEPSQEIQEKNHEKNPEAFNQKIQAKYLDKIQSVPEIIQHQSPKERRKEREVLIRTIQRQKSGSREASLLAERQFLVQGRHFERCRLQKANLFGGNFVQCSFRNADLSRASFGFATLTNSAFTNANLLGCRFPLGEYKAAGVTAIRDGHTLEPIKQQLSSPKISVSPDGNLIAYYRKTEIILAVYPYCNPYCWAAHSVELTALSFSPDSKLLASSSGDMTIRLWDTANYSLRSEYNFGRTVYNAVFSPVAPVVACCGLRIECHLWNFEENRVIKLRGHDTMIEQLSYSVNGTMLASTSFDPSVIVWDLTDNSVYRYLAKETPRTRTEYAWKRALNGVNHLFFANSDTHLVCQYKDQSISVWNLQEGCIVGEFPNPSCGIMQSFPAQDIVCVRDTASVIVHQLDWFLDSGKLATPVKNLRMISLGQQEVLVFNHRNALWVQVDNNQPVELNEDWNWNVSISYGHIVLYSRRKYMVRVHNFAGEAITIYQSSHFVLHASCISRTLLAVITSLETAVVINLETGETLLESTYHYPNQAIPFELSDSGQLLKAHVTRNTVVLFNASDKPPSISTNIRFTQGTLSANKQYCAYVTGVDTVVICKLDSQHQTAFSETAVQDLNFSDDSKHLIIVHSWGAKAIPVKSLLKQ